MAGAGKLAGALKKGAMDYIQKPIVMDSFLILLKNAIARYQIRHAA